MTAVYVRRRDAFQDAGISASLGAKALDVFYLQHLNSAAVWLVDRIATSIKTFEQADFGERGILRRQLFRFENVGELV